jgi:hypothetical protein
MRTKIIAYDYDSDPQHMLNDCINNGVGPLIDIFSAVADEVFTVEDGLERIKNLAFLSITEYEKTCLEETFPAYLASHRRAIDHFLAAKKGTIKQLDLITAKLAELIDDPVTNYYKLLRLIHLYVKLIKGDPARINGLITEGRSPFGVVPKKSFSSFLWLLKNKMLSKVK